MDLLRRPQRWTRRLMAWLVLCVGFLGVLPVLAQMPSGSAAHGDFCVALASADAGSAATDATPADPAAGASHQHCALCVLGAVAPPPQAGLNLVAAAATPWLAPHACADQGRDTAGLALARAPPAMR